MGKKKIEREPIVSLDKIKYLESVFNEEHLNYGVGYFSVYVDLLHSHKFEQLVKKHGFIVQALFLELQAQMLEGGEYYIPLYKVDRVLKIFSLDNNVKIDLVYQVYEDLKENYLIQFLDTSEIFGFSIITSSYVVLNYELTNTNKKIERETKREKRKKAKEKSNNIPSSPLEDDEDLEDFEDPENFTW